MIGSRNGALGKVLGTRHSAHHVRASQLSGCGLGLFCKIKCSTKKIRKPNQTNKKHILHLNMFHKILLLHCCGGLACVFVSLCPNCQLFVKNQNLLTFCGQTQNISFFLDGHVTHLDSELQVNLKRNEKPAHCRTPICKHLWLPRLISSSEFQIYST